MKITIGLTRSNRTRGDDDYIPSFDGWRDGAAQDQVQVELPDSLATLTRTELADAAFVATNAPSRDDMASYPGAQQVLDALTAIPTSPGTQPIPTTMRSLSIGDTVTVDDRKLACVAVGWVDVTDGRDAPPYGKGV